ncbi:MAG: TIGR02147 family protein [Bacteriovoracaceae bacterium]|nr:TIGR02147 family protein [Bacteriovoracaceae bacterium]
MNAYMYLQTSTLLNDKFKEKKRKNSAFSIRSWANHMGFKSHGALQQMLAGKRSIPKKYIHSIAKSLELSVGETMYFETLVDYEKAKTVDEKNIYYERLNHLRPQKREVKFLDVEHYKYFQNPLHSIIRTLIEREDFVNDPAWIQKTLRFKTTQNEIEEVIKRLITLDLLEEEDGKLIKKYKAIQNKIDVPSKAVQEFHKRMSSIAQDEVSKQSVSEREYNSFCFNIKKGQLQNAKKRLREFTQEFMDEFEASRETSDDTYHLNIQLFSLTNKN